MRAAGDQAAGKVPSGIWRGHVRDRAGGQNRFLARPLG